VDQNEDLFGRIDEIERNGFIFVKGDGHQIVSVLTANDLARQFGTMARPFSLLSEAELRLRSQVQKSLPEQFAKQKLKWATAPTFGQYKNILEKPEAFEQLGWPLDHLRFLELLATVVAIRNDLMHVSKDPLTAQHLNAIESFVKMLRLVDQIS
jgi:restriction system protein